MTRPADFDIRAAKAALHKRLHAEKRFEDYVRVREQLKREGVSDREAWRFAAKEFPPQDGSPSEIQSLIDELAMTAGMVKAKREMEAAREVPESSRAQNTGNITGGHQKPNEIGARPPEVPGEPEFFLDGTAWGEPDVLPLAVSPPVDPPQPAATAHTPPVPPPPPTAGANGTGWIKYAKSVQEQSASSAEAWAKLVFAVTQLQKSGGGREVSDWVFNSALIPVELINPADVPSVGALGLLKWVQTSTANYTEFIRSIWSKSLPTKSQMDAEGRFADDGRLQLAMLDDFEQSFSDAA